MAKSITYTPLLAFLWKMFHCFSLWWADNWLNKFSSHFLFWPLTYHGLLPNPQIPPRPCQRPPTGPPDHCLRLRPPSCTGRKAHPRSPWLHHRCHCCPREVGCKRKLTLVVQLNGKARLGETKVGISMPPYTDNDFTMNHVAWGENNVESSAWGWIRMCLQLGSRPKLPPFEFEQAATMFLHPPLIELAVVGKKGYFHVLVEDLIVVGDRKGGDEIFSSLSSVSIPLHLLIKFAH